ncbi:hypothetical protein MES5069_1030005 [Mesorhizobium escarrei]|uniref:Secreted protein n=1 Tax=Mesorhizobium escarrei TaxID=666018 RepID=A0ABM9DFU4_9HYPH|nr:hypothetical protein MES5069_1030005 [Mesorhizobium escarrei]
MWYPVLGWISPSAPSFSSKGPLVDGLGADGLAADDVGWQSPMPDPSRAKVAPGTLRHFDFAHGPQRNRFRFSGSCASLARSVFRRLSVEPKPRYKSR